MIIRIIKKTIDNNNDSDNSHKMIIKVKIMNLTLILVTLCRL